MIEQERGKETPIQFPRVSKDIVLKLWKQTEESNEFLGKAWERLTNKDPVLATTLYVVFAKDKPKEEAQKIVSELVAATFLWAVFEELEAEGISLSPVKQETAETFLFEWADAYQREGNQVIQSEATEFNFPVPFNYCEENPALMTFLLTQGEHLPGYTKGGMFTYELIRRQFHADQLAKQFGG